MGQFVIKSVNNTYVSITKVEILPIGQISEATQLSK